MLTQEQKELLEPLTHHLKFGKLLIDAIKTQEISTPKRGELGVTRWFPNSDLTKAYQFSKETEKNCCLMGAAIFGKDASLPYTYTVREIFYVQVGDIIQLESGFDESLLERQSTDAYNFAKAVGKIVFEN